ncbi:hypothetical protein V8F33_013097 [Rhypophila sp. PSN 637]
MLATAAILTVYLLLSGVEANSHNVQSPLHDKPAVRQHEQCAKANHASRYTVAKTPRKWWWSSSKSTNSKKTASQMRFSTSHSNSDGPISLPQISPMNATSSEQWEFDGVSNDGTQSFIFGFYRDPNYSFLGTGNLRAYFEMAGLVDTDKGDVKKETRYAVVDYAEDSVVEECTREEEGAMTKFTKGTWTGRDFVYTFEISHDLGYAKVTMQNPEVDVSVVLRKRGPSSSSSSTEAARPSLRSFSAEHDTLMAVPHFYWAEPFPVAEVRFSAVFTVPTREKKGNSQSPYTVSWNGMGGHERLWAAFNWYTCLAGMMAVRAQVGPFTLSYVEFQSEIEDGLVMKSMWLAEQHVHLDKAGDWVSEGEEDVIFTASQRVRVSTPGTQGNKGNKTDDDSFSAQMGDVVTVKRLYSSEGVATTVLADRVTGIELILESPRRGKQWRFVLEHKVVGFEYFLGEGVGGTGYSGIARGGPVGPGEPEWEGPGFSEVMRFPKKSWLLNKNLNY